MAPATPPSSGAASQADALEFHLSTWPLEGAVLLMERPWSLTALTLVRAEPSRAGMGLASAIVPLPVIVPPVRPVPAVTEVTVPPLLASAAGAHLLPSYFKTCDAPGAPESTATPCSLAALTPVSAEPSTAGSLAVASRRTI
jgi:hypothetical protein